VTTSAKQFDLMVWRDADGRPAAIGYDVHVGDLTVACTRMTVARPLRPAKRRVELIGQDGRASLLVRWDDALRPALYGDVKFRIVS